jgi:hypothetical protein
MKRYLPAIAAVPLAFASPAQAQDDFEASAEEADSDTICIAIGRRWVGSVRERARILQDPVPRSFVRETETTGCARWQLIEESLVDWHLRYGDARSTRAAIAFLEPLMSGPVEPQVVADFVAGWNAALDDLRAVVRQAGPASVAQYLAANSSAIHARDSIKNLLAVRGKLTGYDAIAHEYTRAAEVFLASELVADARRFQAPTYAVATFIGQQRGAGEVEAFLADVAGSRRYGQRMTATAREISLAVTTAAIEHTPAAIEAAGALTRSRYAPDGRQAPYPDLATFLSRAYEDGADACEPDERNSQPGYEDRCENDGFEIEALDFWFDRSRLELIARRHGVALEPLAPHFRRDGTTERTIDLFMRRAWSEGLRYGEQRTGAEVVRLLVLEAEALTYGPAPCDRGPYGGDPPASRALERLLWAQTLASPARDPLLHRTVAEAYLRSYAAARRCDVRIDGDHRRGALVSRAFLAQYDRLVAAD